MKREALAFFRILPAGAADIGDVSRDELREAGAGQWTMTAPSIDDVGELADYDVPICLDEERTDPGEHVVRLHFRGTG